MRISMLCTVLLVAASACAAQVERVDQGPNSNTLEKAKGDVTDGSGALVLEAVQALKTRVPPVMIRAEHAIFNEKLEISLLESVNAQGAPVDVAPSIEAIASGVAVLPDGSAKVLARGDAVAVGNLIVGGVFENTGDQAVYIGFESGREVTLEPGDVLYVGTYERLLRPDQVPGAQRGSQRGDGVGVPPPPVASHCWVCACKCGSGEAECDITVDATAQTDCSTFDGTPCRCETDGPWATTSGCFRGFVPCETN